MRGICFQGAAFAMRLFGPWILAGLFWLWNTPACRARDIEITILCTTDIHGHLLSARDYEGNTDVGGFLRCASAIEAVRAQRKHVICVDCGDLVQGAPESGITQGLLAVRALNDMGYDAWVLGNHDFDWGVQVLARLHDESRVPMLAANLAGENLRASLPRVRPWILKEVEGVRIAFVGLTTPGTPAWLPTDLREGIEFEESIVALRRVIPEVRSLNPDIWILLIHQGLPEFKDDHANQLLQIAREFPVWDVILGGHTHKVVPGTRLGRSLYVQAGYFGNGLAQIDLTFDNVSRRISHLSSAVIAVGTNWPEHAGLRASLGKDLQNAERGLKRIIGWCESAFSSGGPRGGPSEIQDLIARAVAWKTGADGVLVGYYGEEGLERGPLSVADVWRAIPYENSIGLISLTPAELRMVMDEVSAWEGSPYVQRLWGLRLDGKEMKKTESDSAILRWPNGTPVHGRQRLRIAASSYALASGGRRYPVLRALAQRPEALLQMTDIDTRSAVIEYVRKQKRIRAENGLLKSNDTTRTESVPNERRNP